MGFDIGRAFSPEAEALAQRRIEADRENAARAYTLELQRREQMSKDSLANRELNLRADDVAGQGQDRAARLEMAKADQATTNRKIDLDSQQFQEQMGQRNQQFGIEQGWREKAGQADMDARDRQLDLAGFETADKMDQNDWERNTKFPAEMAVKQDEESRKQAIDKFHAREIEARIGTFESKIRLTNAQAEDLLSKKGIRTQKDAMDVAKFKLDAYKAAANGVNGRDPKIMGPMQDDLIETLSALKTVSPAMYAAAMSGGRGMDVARATGNPMQHGTAGDVMRAMMDKAKRAASGGQAPVGK